MNIPLLRGEDPIGRRVRKFFEGKGNWATIVGIVGSTKDQSVAGPPRPQMYRPLAQYPFLGMSYLVRTDGAGSPLAPALRTAVWSIDKNIPISDIRPLDDVVASSIGQPKTMALLLGAFALLGLSLGAIGVYGVTSARRSGLAVARTAFAALRDSANGPDHLRIDCPGARRCRCGRGDSTGVARIAHRSAGGTTGKQWTAVTRRTGKQICSASQQVRAASALSEASRHALMRLPVLDGRPDTGYVATHAFRLFRES